ncbi:MAG: hypothetical protein KUG56_08105 [Kordiimonadaceae bacterium]|nr:hypothetical protein [Kordiimonadaceae bacterium]
MAEPVKYTFDQAFDGGAKSRHDIEISRLEDEKTQAQATSHAQGVEEGRQQALKEIEAATNETLSQVAQAAHALFSQQSQLETSLKQEMVQLAYAIASKLSPALLQTKPLAEVEALIQDCMVTAHREPRLVVRVAEGLADAVTERIENLKASTNFPGDIVLLSEPGLGLQDCRVEWPDGGTERRQADTQKEIESAVQRFVMSGSEDAVMTDPVPEAANAETGEQAQKPADATE